MPTIHITVDLEAVVRQKLREVVSTPQLRRLPNEQMYLVGYRSALEWVLEQAGLEVTRYHPTKVSQ